MKKAFTAVQLIAVLICMQSTLFAAELLDVKPVVAGGSVSIEISADIPMTYTYYKLPGQARAVVDIAEADPEKVEPLIVVNKGVVSSISVDKAQFSGIVVSRIIFNLVSEADISVSASPDRKLLTVTFGGSTSAASKPEASPELKPEIKPMTVPEPVSMIASPAATGAPQEEDPLGLDEPEVASIIPTAKTSTTKTDSGTELSAAPTAQTPKLEPVVPVTAAPAPSAALTIKEIVTGATFIEIRANQAIPDYKTLKLNSPDRLVIDIATDNTNQKPMTAAINKFGISKVRIGVSPTNIRVVMDSSKAGFPSHTITKMAYGLRINFK
ncbi:MAG: AMIN domain-containing protein [Desulfuromonadaceae bacterium]|nr:AMIN domain-containing protein [Desulfuromonadaceae bacterium]